MAWGNLWGQFTCRAGCIPSLNGSPNLRTRLPFTPYVTSVPVLVTEGLDRVEKEQPVAFVLPSTTMSEIFKRGPKVAGPCLFGPAGEPGVFEFWKTEDPDFVERMGGLDHLARTIPICFHEDGVPRWRGETATFFSWSTPLTVEGSWVSRNCIVGLGSSIITKATRSAILDVISWDLNSLRSGFFPHADHHGQAFAPQSPEGKRAGTPIALTSGCKWTACFCNWKGDQEASAAAHDARLSSMGRLGSWDILICNMSGHPSLNSDSVETQQFIQKVPYKCAG